MHHMTSHFDFGNSSSCLKEKKKRKSTKTRGKKHLLNPKGQFISFPACGILEVSCFYGNNKNIHQHYGLLIASEENV